MYMCNMKRAKLPLVSVPYCVRNPLAWHKKLLVATGPRIATTTAKMKYHDDRMKSP